MAEKKLEQEEFEEEEEPKEEEFEEKKEFGPRRFGPRGEERGRKVEFKTVKAEEIKFRIDLKEELDRFSKSFQKEDTEIDRLKIENALLKEKIKILEK